MKKKNIEKLLKFIKNSCSDKACEDGTCPFANVQRNEKGNLISLCQFDLPENMDVEKIMEKLKGVEI